MTSPSISAQYPFEMSIPSSRPPHSRRRTLPQQNVNGWPEPTSSSSLRPSSQSDGKKKVHWNKDVEDDEKAPHRSSKTRASKSGRTSSSNSGSSRPPKLSSSSSSWSTSRSKPLSSLSSLSLSQDESRSRAPPPTPRIQREPTPDLSDFEHGKFCYCCQPRKQAAEQKMNDQRGFFSMHGARQGD